VYYWDHADAAGIPDKSRRVGVVDVTEELSAASRDSALDRPLSLPMLE
jgi:hypothetical protein